jgi:hypothetical protein
VNQVKSKMSETKQSQNTNSTGRRNKKEEAAAEAAALAEKGRRPKQGGYNNVKNLIEQAWRDSDRFKPVYMMIDSSVNVEELIREFYMEKSGQLHLTNNLRSETVSLSAEEDTRGSIEKAAQAGDWMMLENIHLVPQWLPVLLDCLDNLEKNENTVNR